MCAYGHEDRCHEIVLRGAFLEIRRDRSMFVRKDSRIFGTLFFFLGGRLWRSGVGTRASLSRGTRGSLALLFSRTSMHKGDEAYPALYLADGLR